MKKPQNLRSSFSRTLSLLSVVLLLVSCGSMEKSMKKGDAAWALGEYAEAAAQYKSAYTRCRQKDKKVRAHVPTRWALPIGPTEMLLVPSVLSALCNASAQKIL